MQAFTRLAHMPFAYYDRLSRPDQAIYRQSDSVTAVRLPGGRELWPAVEALKSALEHDDRESLAAAAERLAARISGALGAPPPAVDVLVVRPSYTGGELHGLYTLPPEGSARIWLWMRTARHARVVAFRTFLRTMLHELCHHLDFTVLGLERSFHTEGFFKRESSLFHQLVPQQRQDGAARTRTGTPPRGESGF
jgi:hypothetical protein